MSEPTRTHTGGLFCSEGSTHVSRPSVRVRHPPGGSSGYNFFTGEAHAVEPSQQSSSSSSHQKLVPKEVNIKPYSSPSKEAQPPKQQSSPASASNNSSDVQQAKSSVRVRQPPGGSSGWSFS